MARTHAGFFPRQAEGTLDTVPKRLCSRLAQHGDDGSTGDSGGSVHGSKNFVSSAQALSRRVGPRTLDSARNRLLLVGDILVGALAGS
jgi:hypothetical protein